MHAKTVLDYCSKFKSSGQQMYGIIELVTMKSSRRVDATDLKKRLDWATRCFRTNLFHARLTCTLQQESLLLFLVYYWHAFNHILSKADQQISLHFVWTQPPSTWYMSSEILLCL